MSRKKERKEIDIIAIDETIKNNFFLQKKELEKYNNRREELQKTLNNLQNSSKIDVKKEIQKNLQEVDERIRKIDSEEDFSFYIAETADILQKYKKNMKTPLVQSFMGKTKNRERKEEEKNLEIIEKYINIVKKYDHTVLSDYNINFSKKEENKCENCGSTKDYILDGNFIICTDCFVEQDVGNFTISYKDADRVNISGKYVYDKKTHFRDCINQYQGKQNCTIPQKVYKDLEKQFENHYLLEGDKNTPKEIRFSRITREHVGMFLKELGYSKQYENIILIHYELTGKKPDDISHLEEKLVEDFIILLETYERMCKEGRITIKRINFISTHYVLFQLLHKYKYPCKREDFVILKNQERRELHEDICEELFRELGWNYYSGFF